MFRNGPEMDGGDTAYLGPTTIIEMTIPMSQSSSDATLDDSWVLARPIIYQIMLRQPLLKSILFSLVRVRNTNFQEKIGICLFCQNFSTKYPIFEII